MSNYLIQSNVLQHLKKIELTYYVKKNAEIFEFLLQVFELLETNPSVRHANHASSLVRLHIGTVVF